MAAVPERRTGIPFLIASALLCALTVGGCSLVPEKWRHWLLDSPDRQQDEVSYRGWDSPSNEAQLSQMDQPEWSEQSWIDGAPVTFAPQPLVEADKMKEPVGPVVNSPTIRLNKAEQKIDNLQIEVASLRQDLDAMLPMMRELLASRRAVAASASPQGAGAAGAPAFSPPSAQQGGFPAKAYPGSYIVPGQDAAAQSFHGGVVQNVRFGEHGKKTRIVLDTDRPAKYSYSVENSQGYLSVDVPGAGWQGPMRGTLNQSPLFTHYTVQQTPASGSRLMLHLRRPVKVIYADQLEPNNTYRSHRIFLDVVAE